MGKLINGYVALSNVCGVATFAHAYALHKNFYGATLYMSVNKLLAFFQFNFLFSYAFVLAGLFRAIFFGGRVNLRESEAVSSRFRVAVFDALFAMAAFSSASLAADTFFYFVALFFIRTHVWFVQERIETISQRQDQDQSPQAARRGLLAVAKLCVLLVGLLAACVAFTRVMFMRFGTEGVGINVFFGFEFSVLGIRIISTFLKIIFGVINDVKYGGQWDGHKLAVLYTDLFTSLFMFLYRLGYLCCITYYVRLPLYMIYPVIAEYAGFKKKLETYVNYKRILAVIDSKCPLVNLADHPNADPTCVICRDEMVQGRFLPCGHIIHDKCLRSWLTRQQTCPLCLHNVLDEHPAMEEFVRQQRETKQQMEAKQQARGLDSEKYDNAPSSSSSSSSSSSAGASAATTTTTTPQLNTQNFLQDENGIGEKYFSGTMNETEKDIMIEYLIAKVEEMRTEMETKIDKMQETVNTLKDLVKASIEQHKK